MDMNTIVTEVAAKVVADTSFWATIVGLLGAIVGTAITAASSLLMHRFQEKPARELDGLRMQLLKQMLEDPRFNWRSITTLAGVMLMTKPQCVFL